MPSGARGSDPVRGRTSGSPVERGVPRPVDPEDDWVMLTPGGLASWRADAICPRASPCRGASNE